MPEVGSASLAIIPSFDQSKFVKAGGAAGDKFTDGFYRDSNGRLRNAQGRFVKGFGDTGDAAGQTFGSRFNARLKSVAKVAAVGFGVAAAAAFKFGGDALDEAREAQKVGALTESTIKATGKAAKVTAAQVGDLSNAISKKSGIDDEAIQRGANMLLTFKNIRNEAGKGNKIFNRTTKATADMAAAMAGGSGGEIDLKSASILLGKALNDPVKGLSALTRVGVQFTDQQKAINKALVEGGTLNAMAAFGTKVTATEFAKIQKENNATTQETIDIIMGPMSRAQEKLFKHYEEGGHALEAQRNILKEVNSQFGGAAAAQATEADKLKVAWGNFKEEIGTGLIPVMDELSKFLRKKGIPAAEKFVGWFKKDGVPALKDFGGYVKDAAGYAKDLAKFLNDLPKPAKIAGLVTLFGAIAGAKLRGGNLGGGGGLLGGIGKAVGLAKPVPVFVTNPGFGGGAPGAGGPGAGGPGGRGGIVAGAARLAGPLAFAAGGMWLSKKVGINPAGIPDASNPEAFAKTAAKLVEIKEHLFGSGGVEAGFIRANDAASKLPNQMDQGKTAAERLVSEVFNLKSGMDKIPTNKATRFEAPNLLTLLDATARYKGMLDGLDNRTVETFIKTTRINNDTGEHGDPRFGGFRAHGGSMHPGYTYRVGENGPETVTVGARSTVTPNEGATSTMPTTVILNVDGEQFRAYVDNRINAAGRHPTGRRR